VLIATLQFGFKGGLIATSILGLIIFLNLTVSPWQPHRWLENVILLNIGFLLSWLISRVAQEKELLRRSAEEWRTTFDSISDSVSIHDKNFKITRVNKSFSQRLGMKPKEPIGKTCYEIVHGTKEPMPECPHSKVVKAKKAARAEVFDNRDGSYLEISVSPVFNGQKEVIGTVHIMKDITERKKLQEKMIVSDRLAAVGELSAGVAHEVNNPLTGIMGLSQMLLEKKLPADVLSNVKVINSESKRIAEVISNLLKFARKQAPVKHPINVHDNIKVSTKLDPELPEVVVDRSQIAQVFLNIVLNAEQAMIEAYNKGRLTITTYAKDGNIKIAFSDDGPGIEGENLKHIFDPFFTTKKEGKGTGLGLSICYGILNEHGGRIYAESKPSEGTTFIIEIPI
jgi:PAS domain S-box-containing protein